MNSDDDTQLSDDSDYASANEVDDQDMEPIEPRRSENDYVILKSSDIRESQKQDIENVSSVVSISRDASCILLRHFNWSVNSVYEAWFSNEEKVKNSIGLLEKPVVRFPKDKQVTCGICFDSFLHGETKSAACGHLFCKDCWEGYIGTSINDGPGCMSLRCPDPSCIAFVGQEMINSLTSDENKEKYARFILRSYIEERKMTKWCPAPDCDHAVSFTGSIGNYDVSCRCSYVFCWNCGEEAHRPVDCNTVAKWNLKNTSESENTTWIIAHSKPCPKCKRPIEKNHGCMHMSCTAPCFFQFCWLCLKGWKNHGGSCNRYVSTNKAVCKAEKQRQNAKKMLDRYIHHYERWANNQSSRKTALSDLHKLKTTKIVELSEALAQPLNELDFIIEAWEQIIECRRVLKWTYAYAYYIDQDDMVKIQFFEYLQGEAEHGLERLHKFAEKELEQTLKKKVPVEQFVVFRSTLTSLTRITRDYFENLVTALENGLTEVEVRNQHKKRRK